MDAELVLVRRIVPTVLGKMAGHPAVSKVASLALRLVAFATFTGGFIVLALACLAVTLLTVTILAVSAGKVPAAAATKW